MLLGCAVSGASVSAGFWFLAWFLVSWFMAGCFGGSLCKIGGWVAELGPEGADPYYPAVPSMVEGFEVVATL